MARMGYGYGSEFHLLRHLGYHRNALNRAIEEKTGGRVRDWLDFEFGTEGRSDHLDAELKGVDFVDADPELKSAWMKFWPQTGNVPNWDAVGLLESNSGVEYILVEAKAHVEEIQSSCGAREQGGLDAIRKALDAAINANGLTVSVESWLKPYYQYANRLAHLHFLLQHDTPARLLFIYFCGDDWHGKTLSNGRAPNCPKSEQEWGSCLRVMHQHLGLTGGTELEKRVHHLFLPI